MAVLFNAGIPRTLRKKSGLTQAQLAERSLKAASTWKNC